MLYIHQTTCISPQGVFLRDDPDVLRQMESSGLKPSVENVLKALEPSYAAIPAGILRRMNKSSRLGVGAALPFLRPDGQSSPDGRRPPDGILTGTGHGGMEDSVRFLKQIIEFNEGVLTPGSFVQSTPNSIGAQIALLSHNNGYNITYVHRGLAFENALTDAAMLVEEFPGNSYLICGVDEISAFNHRLEYLDGWYKKEEISNSVLYQSDSPGSIAGEGAVAFLVNNLPANALARLMAVSTLHTGDESAVRAWLSLLLEKHLPPGEHIDLLITGENGDRRTKGWYDLCESELPQGAIVRYKHLCGEYPTASAFGLWVACHLPDSARLPEHMVKKKTEKRKYRYILLYHNHKNNQHSFMLIEKFP